jgi:heme/copper-type cytochrome/quinol oxidase subunit 2
MRHTGPKPVIALFAAVCVSGLAQSTVGAVPPDPKPAARAATPQPASVSTDPTIRKFTVTAKDGGIIPGHIRIRKGQKVHITFTSRDDKYSIRFKDFDIKETLTAEAPVTIVIAPSQAGSYDFSCARTWGVKRFGKNGTLVVTE